MYPGPADDNSDEKYDDSLDPEGPSAEDVARFDRDGTACPSCGSEVYDDAGVCPICGEIIAGGSAGPGPVVIAVVGAVLVAFALILIF